ncbi:unnamed protein product [Peniophora sp. CBMAI 1063]|nr:unnamed protein product [Peniophora sp. CBMAI 1063]
MDVNDFQETKTLTFEWRLRDWKQIYEASKGEQKSRVTKSAMFGNGQWQILFYANAGTGTPGDPGSGHVSLFLSCEPTEEEKEAAAALNGRWVRKGAYTFAFEVHDLAKKNLFVMKEAHNHSFSYKTANWGWAQFAPRNFTDKVSRADRGAFLVTCTITGSPEPPKPASYIPRLPVPRDLLDSFGDLLDDPVYSDVEFVLPRRNGSLRSSKRIFAMKKILRRHDYFDTMFGSGFQEASVDRFEFFTEQESINDGNLSNDSISEITSLGGRIDDSDEEDEDDEDDERADIGIDSSVPPTTESSDDEGVRTPLIEHSDVQSDDPPLIPPRAKFAEPPTPQSNRTAPVPRGRTGRPASVQHIQPPRMRVVVKDVAYSTYRAVLYYLYTDIIHFAPLSSTFYTMRGTVTAPTQTVSESQVNLVGGASGKTGQSAADTSYGQTVNSGSRKEWIREWTELNPGRPLPCSAKAVYRLADKLGLRELRERAFEHIKNGLTVENVPYEVFSTFSATYEAVRKVEVKFFLDHWTQIRTSEAMRNVWQQIRVGRHPGFEEVWPVIATHLEFNPQSTTSTSDRTMD